MVDVSRKTIINASGEGAGTAAILPIVQDELCIHRPPPTAVVLRDDLLLALLRPIAQPKTAYLFFNDKEAAFMLQAHIDAVSQHQHDFLLRLSISRCGQVADDP